MPIDLTRVGMWSNGIAKSDSQLQGVRFMSFQSNSNWALFICSHYSAGRRHVTPGRRSMTLAEASDLGFICTMSARRFTYAAI